MTACGTLLIRWPQKFNTKPECVLSLWTLWANHECINRPSESLWGVSQTSFNNFWSVILYIVFLPLTTFSVAAVIQLPVGILQMHCGFCLLKSRAEGLPLKASVVCASDAQRTSAHYQRRNTACNYILCSVICVEHNKCIPILSHPSSAWTSVSG